ncbi:glycosyltransferase family 39 protein [Leptospira perdikensis]|uniref:Dolichyl-phosphate-mannose--protein mannosyltransferase n=1 Tax=Leptospira perdikensis TaxID=2484948 RepID=A0A4R9JDE5_9LEPT|nr:dolichyl-phosphate-mannose--protein mannosyltransferase [Leptospira perdikensis]TGL37141.1 dolichyl-phosphate-mannose--protein mannosyltransferase [Leptospira perdikensis]
MKQQNFTFHRYRFELGILLVLAIGVFLRLYQLDRQSLWGDELYSVYGSSLSSWSDFWIYLAEDPHPPLFQILLSYWIRFLPKFTEFSIKLFPVSISILNLFVLWILTQSWEKPKRFVFLFLISLSPGAIYYAQEVRSYSLLLCLSSIILVLFVNLDNKTSQRFRFISLVITSILVSYVHLFGFIFVGSLYFVFWLRFLWKRDEQTRWVFLLGLLTFLAFIPFLYQLMNGTKIATASWIDPPSLLLYLAYYSLFFYTSKKFLFLTVIVPILVFFYWIFKDIRGWKGSDTSERFSSSQTFLFVAFCIVISTSLFSLFKPIVTNRNWIVTLPLIYYFVADHLKVAVERWYTIVVLIFLTLFSLIDFKKNYYFVFKEDWRGAAHFIANNCEPPVLFSDSYPEYLSLYLSWDGHKEFSPVLTGADLEISQSKICVVKRFLGGNGLGLPSSVAMEKVGQSLFYGFTIEEYKKK